MLWLRVNGGSRTNFWNSFCRLLERLDGERSQKLRQMGLPIDSISLDEVINLIAGIDFPNNSVLLIDDYHLVSNLEICSLMEFLAINEIDNLHIVLIGRYLELPRLENLH